MLFNSSVDNSSQRELNASTLVAGILSGALAFSQGIQEGGDTSFINFLLMLLGGFTILPLFVIGLSQSFISLIFACVTALLTYGCGLALIQKLQLQSLGIFSFFHLLPVILLSHQALLNRRTSAGVLEWYPVSLLMMIWTGLGSLGVGLLILWPDVFIPGADAAALDRLLAELPQITNSMTEADNFRRLFKMLWPFLPGMTMGVWMLTILMNGICAQCFLKNRGQRVRPAIKIQPLTVDSRILIALALTGATAILLPSASFFVLLAQNVALVLLIPFFFVGLETVHVLCKRIRHRRLTLGVFYCFMVVFSWITIAVVALGIFEPWLRLRKYINIQEKH